MLLNASGCLDALAAPEVVGTLDAYVTKTVTPRPREGNAPVRIAEAEVGMLNSIGLANVGIDAFVREQLPRLAELDVPIWVSVGGFGAADFAALCARLDGESAVAAIELNLSCPNVEAPEERIDDLVAAARAASSKPLFAKLSPAVPSIARLASAAEAAGADGLTLVNTVRGLVLDSVSVLPRLATAVGGLSGPALKPIALAAVYDCYAATPLPIVGVGGIRTGRDALEFVAAGASALALGTVLFSDPSAAVRVRAELGAELAALSVASLGNACGLAHRDTPPWALNSRLEVESCGLYGTSKNTCKSPKTMQLDRAPEGAIFRRHGREDPSSGSRAIPRSEDGGAQAGE